MPVDVTFHGLFVFEHTSTFFACKFGRHLDLTDILVSPSVVAFQHLHPTLFTSYLLIKGLGSVTLVDKFFVGNQLPFPLEGGATLDTDKIKLLCVRQLMISQLGMGAELFVTLITAYNFHVNVSHVSLHRCFREEGVLANFALLPNSGVIVNEMLSN